MSDTPILYTVHGEIHPDIIDDYLEWLINGHIDDVLSAPGFLWGYSMRLDERAADGWIKLVNRFGVESQAALNRYQASDLFKGFAKEVVRFDGKYRTHRTIEPLVFAKVN